MLKFHLIYFIEFEIIKYVNDRTTGVVFRSEHKKYISKYINFQINLRVTHCADNSFIVELFEFFIP